MTSTFNTNFKNMILIIGKAASQEADCPINQVLLGKLIDYMFNDLSRASKIADKFKENRDIINESYMKINSNFNDAIKNRDRNLFNHIELFPKELSKQYGSQIQWFSNFLVKGMLDKHMDIIWRYLEKLNNQV